MQIAKVFFLQDNLDKISNPKMKQEMRKMISLPKSMKGLEFTKGEPSNKIEKEIAIMLFNNIVESNGFTWS